MIGGSNPTVTTFFVRGFEISLFFGGPRRASSALWGEKTGKRGEKRGKKGGKEGKREGKRGGKRGKERGKEGGKEEQRREKRGKGGKRGDVMRRASSALTFGFPA